MESERQPRFKRAVFKLSGEAFQGDHKSGIDPHYLDQLSVAIQGIYKHNVELSIVVGGGNFWRGRDANLFGMKQAQADQVGMLATLMNALALQGILERDGLPVRVMSAIPVPSITEPYIRRKAIRHLENKNILIFACGTGSPFFSTDTAAALRAAEIDAEIVLKGTNVEYVYAEDPRINPSAEKYHKITYTEVLSKNLTFMDATSISLCRDNSIPIIVFSIKNMDNLHKVFFSDSVGTLITNQ
ncbi:MAG: UMP kinase [Caldisericia bacterium]|nr:UMP kinase [Caldisericia bacterium]MDD4615227.1 UMP kinase [Caldisericia bacterium]